ncbi:hypothetical protein F2Q69_00008615 [Brassica cretica]|uniref:Uncharacterized protein n=1 Tax=Brassica cretica TaxID=69181 RepID=A0A8S9P4L0_BRACR|nr:hypothetical protein F2Q69_00008615 [Brassica cretica]
MVLRATSHSLKNFFALKPKEIYRVADLRVTICFSKVLKPTVDIGETLWSMEYSRLQAKVDLPERNQRY